MAGYAPGNVHTEIAEVLIWGVVQPLRLSGPVCGHYLSSNHTIKL